MPVRISHNAQLKENTRNLGIHQTDAARQIVHLSSGQRVNRASDDPASLSLADGIHAETRALTEGTRNIQQSVNMLQIAEDTLSQMNTIARRMNTLASQAATSTLNDENRRVINAEFGQLRNEMDRLANAASYNEIPLLQAQKTFVTQIGPTQSKDDQAAITLNDLRASGPELDMASMTMLTMEDGRQAISHLQTVVDRIVEERNKIGAFQNRLELSIDTSTRVIERMTAAESAFRDIDVAASTTQLAQAQILGQAAASISIESDTNIDRVLALLQ